MTKYCPNCGKPNKDGDKFCSECGSSMNPRSVVNRPINNMSEISPQTLFLLVFILVLFLVIIVTFSRTTVTIWY